MSIISSTTYERLKSRGFTLIELLVTVAIIATITALSVAGRTMYDRSLLLTNLTYDIALAIREAQVYGIDVRVSTSSTPFDVGYGVNVQSLPATNFTLFIDQNSNHFFDAGDTGVRTYSIKNNNRIYALCTVLASDSSNTCTSRTTLNITFRRPDPDACFSIAAVSNAKPTPACVATTGYSEARITVQNITSTNTKCIRVYTTGQISITPTC
jgi:prepilin-type N-terminal cleavage/methylation domain-containing protein